MKLMFGPEWQAFLVGVLFFVFTMSGALSFLALGWAKDTKLISIEETRKSLATKAVFMTVSYLGYFVVLSLLTMTKLLIGGLYFIHPLMESYYWMVQTYWLAFILGLNLTGTLGLGITVTCVFLNKTRKRFWYLIPVPIGYTITCLSVLGIILITKI